ncbi:TetR/AcrR family transcriptional regulator [Microbacterium sp. gxy059]|uniref:TetR/AcrR family transcriptional regulator n=1 Tax=Microbacterium sp. gxy059 TaxID=2957199 RepID=UPI003D979F44
MTETVRRRANTRTRLVDAAEALFVETGATRVGIDALCARAGFTRGAFYSNFSSVDDVFFAVYERRTRALLDAVAAAPRPERPARTVEQIADHLVDAVPAEPAWLSLRAGFAARAGHDEALETALREHAEQLRAGLTPRIEALVADAGLRLAHDPAEATRIVIAANVGAVLQGPLVDDPRRLRRDVLAAALAGITRRADEGASA